MSRLLPLPLLLVVLAAHARADEPPAREPPFVRPNYLVGYHESLHWTPISHTDWYMGAGLAAVRVLGDGTAMSSGVGGSVWLGLHVIDRLALELGWIGSGHELPGGAALLAQAVTTDLRIYLVRSRLDVYGQGGLGLYVIGPELHAGLQAGGGIDYWVGDGLTVGFRVLWRGMLVSPSEPMQSVTLRTTASLEAAVAMHF